MQDNYYKTLEEDILEYIFKIPKEQWEQPYNSPVDMIYNDGTRYIISEFKSRRIHSTTFDSFFIEPSKIKGILQKVKELNPKKFNLYFIVYCTLSNDIFIFNLYDILQKGLLVETGSFNREKNHLTSSSKIVSNSCYTIDKNLAIKKLQYEPNKN